MHTLHRSDRLLAMVAVLLFVYPFPLAQLQNETATVHLKFVDFRGRDLGEGTVALFVRDEEGAKNFANAFHGRVASHVPFGLYHLRARKKGYYSADRTIPVYNSDTWAVIELDLGLEGGNPRYDITGMITDFSASEGSLWIRTQGLYSTLIADSPVTNRGEFSLAGLRPGTYILSVYQDNRVLHVMSVEVPSKVPTVISLHHATSN